MNRIESDKITRKNQKEMLIVMTALSFIEGNALMTKAQLNDAKKSLQALFIRTSGEETMLRKLIEILKLNKELHQSFSEISKISDNISTGTEVISKKIDYLKQYTNQLQLTPQESTDFFDPFLSFTHTFQEKVLRFNKDMLRYLELREQEAQRIHEFRIAQDASKRLRDRLSGTLGMETQGEVEKSIRMEVLETFDFAEAQNRLAETQHESRLMARQVHGLLQEMKSMCRMAMNPDMRDQNETGVSHNRYEDIFSTFTWALRRYSRLEQIKDFIIEYFKLYQRIYGMFVLDFNNFNQAVESISKNPVGYFESKQEDKDIRVKRDKLRKIEGLIPFLETANTLIVEHAKESFVRFSRRISETISTENGQWVHVAEHLLVAKVAAEADLTTRIRE